MKNRALLFAALSLCLVFIGCSKRDSPGNAQEAKQDSKPAPLDPNEAVDISNPAMAPVGYLEGVAKSKKSAEGKIALASLTQAINQFTTVEGSKPKSFDDLIQKGYLTKVPTPPYGMKFTYDPATGKPDVVMAR